MEAAAFPIAIGLMVGGTAFSAFAEQQRGKSEEAWHKYNARILAQQGQAEREAALVEMAQFGKGAEKFKAEQRVKMAAGGAKVDVRLMEDISAELEWDKLMIGRRGLEAERAAKMGAIGERYKGKIARQAGQVGMMGTLLAGGAQTVFTTGAMKGWWEK